MLRTKKLLHLELFTSVKLIESLDSYVFYDGAVKLLFKYNLNLHISLHKNSTKCFNDESLSLTELLRELKNLTKLKLIAILNIITGPQSGLKEKGNILFTIFIFSIQ